jgi:hypothetical protein
MGYEAIIPAAFGFTSDAYPKGGGVAVGGTGVGSGMRACVTTLFDLTGSLMLAPGSAIA